MICFFWKLCFTAIVSAFVNSSCYSISPLEDSFLEGGPWSFIASKDNYCLVNKPWLGLPTDKTIGVQIERIGCKVLQCFILEASKFLLSNNLTCYVRYNSFAVKMFRKIAYLVGNLPNYFYSD